MDASNKSTRPADIEDDEDDVEGHAFKWQVVTDRDGGKKLRAGWTPDEPGKPQTPSRDPKNR